MKHMTMTVYLTIDDSEDPNDWDVSEWLGAEVTGWEFTDGHPAGCRGCAQEGETDER